MTKLIDMGSYWFDPDMRPTVKLDSDGNIVWRHYCPYIPKDMPSRK